MMEQLSKVGNGQAAGGLVEKRSCPHFPLSTGAEAFASKANLRITGRLSDIGRNGCCMDTISPFAVNAVVIVTITTDSGIFMTKAKVVYSLNAMGMGLMFTETEPDQVRVLESWLDELSGGILVEPDAPALTPEALAEVAHGADPELRDFVRELIVLLSRESIS